VIPLVEAEEAPCTNLAEGFIAFGYKLRSAVEVFKQHARRFFYEVLLSELSCPKCAGRLAMLRDACCRCRACGHTFDPTPVFQKCRNCGGTPRVRTRRYQCTVCDSDVPSRFIFDGLVFDAEYFRSKMADSRRRKRELRDRVRDMLRNTRSASLNSDPVDLQSVPGLVDAINDLIGKTRVDTCRPRENEFDFGRYEQHVRESVGPGEVSFEAIPALEGNPRQDRIWRFIALVFLAHQGRIRIWQEGQTIMVIQNEVN
jgi:hypothetical protein